MSKVKNNSSLPSGKDEHLVTVVREQWHKYQVREKRFSKAVALALINLHKQHAKPGYGQFVARLKDLKIPTSTAYRLMRLHGWQPDKKITRTKGYTVEEHQEARYEVFRNEVRAYCAKVRKNPEYRAKLEAFFQEVTDGLGVVVEVRSAVEPSFDLAFGFAPAATSAVAIFDLPIPHASINAVVPSSSGTSDFAP
jgi:hypothetical protein